MHSTLKSATNLRPGSTRPHGFQMAGNTSQPLTAAVTADAGAKYAIICARRAQPQDPLVVAALNSGSSTVAARGDRDVGALVELVASGVAPFVFEMNLGGARLKHGTVERVAAFLENDNVFVTTVALSRTRIGDRGVGALFLSLLRAKQSPLESLDLRSVGMTRRGALAAAASLKALESSALRHVDFSNNRANHRGVIALQDATACSHGGGITVDIEGNLFIVELLNALTHGLGAGGAVAGGTLMVLRSLALGLPLHVTAGLLVFAASLFVMMTSSCLYHSCFRKPHAMSVFQKADHCSIFFLIAGTYTPFIMCYTLDPPTVEGPMTLVLVWLCAVGGVAMSVGSSRASSKTRAYFALGMGWIGAASVKLLLDRMQRGALWAVVSGGVTYSLGIIFYLLGKRNPFLHVIWHVAVMIGGGFHYFALWRYVVHG